MKYSLEDCFNSASHSHEWGPEARKRADLLSSGELPTGRTMCSEFVAYC